jgi:hypothetical protein
MLYIFAFYLPRNPHIDFYRERNREIISGISISDLSGFLERLILNANT